jgi:hypothetical protein
VLKFKKIIAAPRDLYNESSFVPLWLLTPSTVRGNLHATIPNCGILNMEDRYSWPWHVSEFDVNNLLAWRVTLPISMEIKYRVA